MSPGRPGARAARGSPPRGVRSGNRRFVARNLQGRGRGWRLWVGAWLAVVGGCMGGIATIGLRHAGDTPWRGVYGSKTPVGVGWWLCLVVAGPAVGAWLAVVGAWLAVVGGCVGGIATIGLRHAGDTPWWGVYGSKTPCWCGLVAVFGRGWACCGRVAGPAVGAWLGLLWVRGWRLCVGVWGELRP